MKRSAFFILLIALSGASSAASCAIDNAPISSEPRAGGSSMSNETVMRDLFDRWERVWHEGRYDLIPSCVGPNYIRHDEAGDRTLTREACAAEIAKIREERPNIRVACTITRSKATARGFVLRSSGLIPRPASRAIGRACSPTGSRPASSLRLG
jgi:hypothetical protein